jgi:hypothetical protein
MAFIELRDVRLKPSHATSLRVFYTFAQNDARFTGKFPVERPYLRKIRTSE